METGLKLQDFSRLEIKYRLIYTQTMKDIKQSLTFDDVLLVPAASEVLPRDVSLTTRLTKNIELNIPYLSAAMDTVTEYELAIAIAQMGGIGFIHKNMSIEEQAAQVRKVKRSESGLIVDPITLTAADKVGDAERVMAENKIGGIPIVDEHKKLIGIVTNRDLLGADDPMKPISEIMTAENLITAPAGTDLTQAEEILKEHKHRIEKLPVVDDNDVLVGLITRRDIVKVKKFPTACKDDQGRLRVGAAVGVTADTLERVQALVDVHVDVITIDTAHGHSKGVIDMVKKVKDTFPDLDIIAGNIATGAAAVALAEAGADAVKVGIGPGSICTTRVIAGVGVPQLSAIMNVVDALEKKHSDVGVIADGGIKQTGDVPKAIAAGADCIMAGSMYAGTEEAPGEITFYDGRKFKTYRGMGSAEAMEAGSSDRYFQGAEKNKKKLVPEGIVGRVPYKGTVSEVLDQYIGGLRAGMGYCGAATIAKMKDAEFTRITHAGYVESHPHDVTITKESTNYHR